MEKELIAYLFDKAAAQGLESCQLYYVADEDYYLDSHEGTTTSETAALRLDAVYEGRTVSAYTENISVSGADFLVRVCVENAGFLEPADSPPLYVGQGRDGFSSLDPTAADSVALGHKLDEFHRILPAYGPEFSESSLSLKSQLKTVRVVNEKGLDVQATTSRVFAVVTLIYSKDGKSSDSYFYLDGNSPGAIVLEQAMAEHTAYVRAHADSEQPESGRYNAVFKGSAFSYLVMVSALFYAKDYVDSGQTRFAGKLGQRVGSPLVTIVDNPRLEGGFFSVPFDAQGVPTRKRELVKNGILNSLCCDLKTANDGKGLAPGCMTCSRISLPPAISVTNMYIEPGNSAREDLFAEAGDGIYITQVLDYFHRHGTDPATGDFSMPAKGFLIKGDKLAAPVTGFSIAGNLYDILEQVKGVGDTLGYGLPSCLIPGMPMRIGGHASPDLLVEGLLVSGKGESAC